MATLLAADGLPLVDADLHTALGAEVVHGGCGGTGKAAASIGRRFVGGHI